MKIIIIGAGPAGYTAAIEAARKNFEVILIEKHKLGGVCLNYGCIPTKSIWASCELIKKIKNSEKFGLSAECKFNYEDILNRKEKIVKDLRDNLERFILLNKIKILYGEAEIIKENVILLNGEELEADKIIISTGSVSRQIGTNGIAPEEVFLKDFNGKEINILGAGAIGCEFAHIFSMLGFKVNLFEKESRILPFLEEEAANIIAEELKKSGVNIFTHYLLEDNKNFILCCGREASVPQSKIILEREGNFLKVDSNCKTNVDSIYAIGDVNGNNLLAHWAMEEGKRVIDFISEGKSSESGVCPNAIFTAKEVAFFGSFDPKFRSIKVTFANHGKALAISEEGFIKLFLDAKGLLKGGVILAENSSELIHLLIPYYNQDIGKLKKEIFFHPSLSEILKLF